MSQLSNDEIYSSIYFLSKLYRQVVPKYLNFTQKIDAPDTMKCAGVHKFSFEKYLNVSPCVSLCVLPLPLLSCFSNETIWVSIMHGVLELCGIQKNLYIDARSSRIKGKILEFQR